MEEENIKLHNMLQSLQAGQEKPPAGKPNAKRHRWWWLTPAYQLVLLIVYFVFEDRVQLAYFEQLSCEAST